MVFKMQTLQNDIRRTCICFLHQPTPQALGSQPEATAVARVPYGNIWIKVSLGFAFKKMYTNYCSSAFYIYVSLRRSALAFLIVA